MEQYIEGLRNILRIGLKEYVGYETQRPPLKTSDKFARIYVPLTHEDRFDIRCEIVKAKRHVARLSKSLTDGSVSTSD